MDDNCFLPSYYLELYLKPISFSHSCLLVSICRSRRWSKSKVNKITLSYFVIDKQRHFEHLDSSLIPPDQDLINNSLKKLSKFLQNGILIVWHLYIIATGTE